MASGCGVNQNVGDAVSRLQLLLSIQRLAPMNVDAENTQRAPTTGPKKPVSISHDRCVKTLRCTALDIAAVACVALTAGT